MTSLQILGSNEELRARYPLSIEGNEKLQPSNKHSPKPRLPKNNNKKEETSCRRNGFMPKSLAQAVEMQMHDFSSGSISSLDTSLSDDECDDEIITVDDEPFEDIPRLTAYNTIEEDNKNKTNNSSRWETKLSQDCLPSSPIRRTFEIKRSVADRLNMAPRRASCDILPVVPIRRWDSFLSDCSEFSTSARVSL
jgi:hypothetical protein